MENCPFSCSWACACNLHLLHMWTTKIKAQKQASESKAKRNLSNILEKCLNFISVSYVPYVCVVRVNVSCVYACKFASAFASLTLQPCLPRTNTPLQRLKIVVTVGKLNCIIISQVWRWYRVHDRKPSRLVLEDHLAFRFTFTCVWHFDSKYY